MSESKWKRVFIGEKRAAHLHFALQLSQLLLFKLQVVGELLTFRFQLSNSTPQGVCALPSAASRESERGGKKKVSEVKSKSGTKKLSSSLCVIFVTRLNMIILRKLQSNMIASELAFDK